jgi:hypothetical protein
MRVPAVPAYAKMATADGSGLVTIHELGHAFEVLGNLRLPIT